MQQNKLGIRLNSSLPRKIVLKVWVVAHIPGGDGEALEGWALNYYKAVNRFQNTITAQFYGHTHSTNFYMVYTDPEDATSRPTSVVYAAPSATTYSEYFPAYRIYSVDGNYPGSSYVSLINNETNMGEVHDFWHSVKQDASW